MQKNLHSGSIILFFMMVIPFIILFRADIPAKSSVFLKNACFLVSYEHLHCYLPLWYKNALLSAEIF